MGDWHDQVGEAVKIFWRTRETQAEHQGLKTGVKDQGARSMVTGGKQMVGFQNLIRNELIKCGILETDIYLDQHVELPGYFRPEKKWDIIVVSKDELVAAIEFKSQVGPSFGNNYNNRTEEAIGSATDLWTAYREGAFEPSPRPWLGYLMLLEETPRSMQPVKNYEPHFKVFPEFRNASYSKRYEILMTKLLRERLYDAACFILSNAIEGREGAYNEPTNEVGVNNFMASLAGQITTFIKAKKER